MSGSVVHLVRHGEVENPNGVVYASLPGFGLSERGSRQAAAAAEYLAGREIGAVIASPLDRAWETAAAFQARHAIAPKRDDRLVEWALGERWSGARWGELDSRFPGELDAYFDHPESLPFSPESLADLASRVGGAVRELVKASEGELVLVSHQDPIQAARLALTERPLASLQTSKPGHASIVSLQAEGSSFAEIGYWEPEQGPGFPPADER